MSTASPTTSPELSPTPEETTLGDPESASQSRIYRGRTVEELIPRIEAELGVDAIVVRRRTGLTGGIGGFFQRPFVEIEARTGTPGVDVYDEGEGEPLMPPPPSSPGAPAPLLLAHRGRSAYLSSTLTASETATEPPLPGAQADDEFHELTPESLTGDPQIPAPTEVSMPFSAALAAAESADADGVRASDRRSSETATESSEMATQITEPPAGENDRATSELPVEPAPSTLTREPLEPARFVCVGAAMAPAGRPRKTIEAQLTAVGLSEEFVCELIDSAAAHVLPVAPRLSLARAVHQALSERISRCLPLPVGPATIAVIGPGGSGKTSCCAALLGAYRRRSTLPAACATIVPGNPEGELELVLSPYAMSPTPVSTPLASRALDDAARDGLLLLDLPPLSPGNRTSIQAVTKLLESRRPDRVVLALPATVGAIPTAQLLEALAPLGLNALAITHADETDQLGVAVEAAYRHGLAPAYLLEEPDARAALTPIDPSTLADRLLS